MPHFSDRSRGLRPQQPRNCIDPASPGRPFVSFRPPPGPRSRPGRPRVVDVVLRGGGHQRLAVQLAQLHQRAQRPDGDRLGVHAEVSPRRRPGVGQPEAVGAQRVVVAGHPGPDLVRHRAHPVRHRDDRARPRPRSARRHVRHLAARASGCSRLCCSHSTAVAAQLAPRGHRPHVRRDAPVLGRAAPGRAAPTASPTPEASTCTRGGRRLSGADAYRYMPRSSAVDVEVRRARPAARTARCRCVR